MGAQSGLQRRKAQEAAERISKCAWDLKEETSQVVDDITCIVIDLKQWCDVYGWPKQ